MPDAVPVPEVPKKKYEIAVDVMHGDGDKDETVTRLFDPDTDKKLMSNILEIFISVLQDLRWNDRCDSDNVVKYFKQKAKELDPDGHSQLYSLASDLVPCDITDGTGRWTMIIAVSLFYYDENGTKYPVLFGRDENNLNDHYESD